MKVISAIFIIFSISCIGTAFDNFTYRLLSTKYDQTYKTIDILKPFTGAVERCHLMCAMDNRCKGITLSWVQNVETFCHLSEDDSPDNLIYVSNVNTRNHYESTLHWVRDILAFVVKWLNSNNLREEAYHSLVLKFFSLEYFIL